MSKKYQIGEEDRVELYEDFFKKMIDFGYSPQFIGEELALVARALRLAEGNYD